MIMRVDGINVDVKIQTEPISCGICLGVFFFSLISLIFNLFSGFTWVGIILMILSFLGAIIPTLILTVNYAINLSGEIRIEERDRAIRQQRQRVPNPVMFFMDQPGPAMVMNRDQQQRQVDNITYKRRSEPKTYDWTENKTISNNKIILVKSGKELPGRKDSSNKVWIADYCSDDILEKKLQELVNIIRDNSKIIIFQDGEYYESNILYKGDWIYFCWSPNDNKIELGYYNTMEKFYLIKNEMLRDLIHKHISKFISM